MRNPDANEAIQAGRRAMLNSYILADLDHAIPLFRKAVTLEPKSSLAHCYLAMAATARTYFIADPAYVDLGKTEARTALELAPDSTDAHRALAAIYYQECEFDEALEEEMRRLGFGGMTDRISSFLGMVFDRLGRAGSSRCWNDIW